MFDHRGMLCNIRVINSRCDILLDRSVVTHGFSRCGHNKILFTHRLLGSFQSLPLWRQHFSCGCHLPSASSLLCTALCSACIVWICYRHVSASRSFCREMTRARWSMQRGGSKIRSSLQRAEMIYYVTLSLRGSWTQTRHSGTGSMLIGHLRSPEVTPVRRACAYVERRSGLLEWR